MKTNILADSSRLSTYLFALTFVLLSFTSVSAPAATMVGYYSLDDLIGGVQNQGTAGITGNTLTVVGPGASLPVATSGFIGGGMQFNGVNSLGTTTAGNLGTISSYPFSMSVWIQTTAAGIAMSLSARASTDRYLGLGVSGGDAIVTRRNTTALTTDSNTPVSDGAWHQLVASYNGNQNTQIYVDGKLVVTDTTTTSGMMSSNTFVLGAILRTNMSALQLISTYTGVMDDAGLFTGGTLTSAEVALVNGLGRTSTLGLNWLDEAYALSLAANGATAVLGGYTWQRVSGLAGTTGDYFGTAAGGNAYIITDASGNGIQVVPEPRACLLLTLGLMGIGLRRRR